MKRLQTKKDILDSFPVPTTICKILCDILNVCVFVYFIDLFLQFMKWRVWPFETECGFEVGHTLCFKPKLTQKI